MNVFHKARIYWWAVAAVTLERSSRDGPYGEDKVAKTVTLRSRSAKALQENVTRSGPAPAPATTLVGAIILLGGIGYALDRWQGRALGPADRACCSGSSVGFYELVEDGLAAK